jgi:hypothetical protein
LLVIPEVDLLLLLPHHEQRGGETRFSSPNIGIAVACAKEGVTKGKQATYKFTSQKFQQIARQAPKQQIPAPIKEIRMPINYSQPAKLVVEIERSPGAFPS